ncbi:MAG: phosphate propanoyltransferase [Candidatus Kerfeldbacteria bacterium]|nr:phosphate propanoyltransferase [Candidatus Kerfeldbacteria bacterium]
MTMNETTAGVTVPVEVSNRHVHVSAGHLETLFGPGASLHQHRSISQTDQFAARETVTLIGPRGRVENVRLVGPVRSRTQVEVSQTDARQLGVSAPLRDSGDLDGSAGLTLAGPRGRVTLSHGVIVQRRHIHASPLDCQTYGLKPHSIVRLRIGGPRGLIFDQVLVKVDPSFVWRLHLDTDEANAAGVKPGDVAEVLP